MREKSGPDEWTLATTNAAISFVPQPEQHGVKGYEHFMSFLTHTGSEGQKPKRVLSRTGVGRGIVISGQTETVNGCLFLCAGVPDIDVIRQGAWPR